MRVQRRSFIQLVIASMSTVNLSALAQSSPSAMQSGMQFQGEKPNLALLESIVDAVIPRTLTPGAIDTGTVSWILDIAWETLIKNQEKMLLVMGLSAINAAAMETRGAPFSDWTFDQRSQSLAQLDAAATAPTGSADEQLFRGFWFTVKKLVIVGHYTSEAGCKAELDFNPVPGPFVGDISISEKSRTFYQDWIGVPFIPGAPIGGARS